MIFLMFWCTTAVIFAAFNFFSGSLEGRDWEEWKMTVNLMIIDTFIQINLT